MKAKAKTTEMKEIRFTPNTDDHDFDFKSKHAESFLKEGNKVKAYVQFKGRAIQFKDRGELLLLKFADRLKEVGSWKACRNWKESGCWPSFHQKPAKSQGR
jgi:translation initiation factor IF-3